MVKMAILIFRKFSEIALFLGIILAVTKRIDKSRFHIILGCMLGVIGSAIMAFFIKILSISFFGTGDQIFKAIIILITVLMMSWIVTWIHGYSTQINIDFSEHATKITASKATYLMLSLTIALTMLRECTEIISEIYMITYVENLDSDSYLWGLGLGTASSIVIGVLVYKWLTRFSSKYIFTISLILLMLISAGLASQAADILTSIGVITVLSDELWDSSWLMNDLGIIGKSLNGILGYDAHPNGMQIIFYFSTICIIAVFSIINKRIQLSRENYKHKK